MAHDHVDNIDVVVVISKAMDPARKPSLCVCVCVCVWKRYSNVSDPRHLLNKSHYRERERLKRVPSFRGQTLGTR